MRTIRTCSVLALLALTAAGCSDKDPVRAPEAVRAGLDGGPALTVEADLAISRLVVTIDDGSGARSVDIRRDEKGGGLAAGALGVVPGTRAKVSFRGYDAAGQLTHQGRGALDVGKEVTSQQEFALQPVPGADLASVRIGTYRLAITPTVVDGNPERAALVQATLLDAQGKQMPINPGSMQWMQTKAMGGIGAPDFGYGPYWIDIKWPLGKWWQGATKFCLFDYNVCGKLTVQDPNPVVQVVAASFHSCVLRKSGTVKCWGDNSNRQLGVEVSTNLNTNGTSWIAGIVFKSISASGLHTCGVDDSDSARCWGSNGSGQLGVATPTMSDYPVIVNGLPDKVKLVTAGGAHSCALLFNGETWCWGLGAYGQLGDGSAIGTPPVNNTSVPVKVANAPVFTTISAGYDHTCGLTATGAAWCWGNNSDGQIGIAATASDQCDKHPVGNTMWWANCATTARQVQTSVSFAGIGSGTSSTCAWTASGAGYCWGRVNGTFTSYANGNAYIPRTPTTQPSWKFFTAASQFECGIDAANMVECLGVNDFGQTGTGTNTPGISTANPTPVTVQDTWTSVDGGQRHACGVRGGGYVVSCWGNNDYGQLGSVTPSGLSASPATVTVKF